MSTKLKLSEVFMLRFNELRNETNDNPQTLITFFSEKRSFRELSQNVRELAEKIEQVGDFRKYHAQIPAQFILDWKTYLYKWKKEIDYISYIDACEELSAIGLDNPTSEPLSFKDFKKRPPIIYRDAPDSDWDENFNPSEHDGGMAIANMLQLAEHELDMKRSYDDDPVNNRMANTWSVGIQAIRFSEETIGIDLGDVFSRWNKMPSVFVPIHVSNKHGLSDKSSLYGLLDQAIIAYVAGAFAASIAMCRAILEIVLKDHYLRHEKGKPGDLCKVINLAVKRYDFLPAKKLHNLRENANKTLHDFGKSDLPNSAYEDDLIGFFKDLKFYIERAPE